MNEYDRSVALEPVVAVAHVNRVLHSYETDGAERCVDIFVRPDGTFGFEEYRRDVEDARGWFPTGFHSARLYPNEAAATAAALGAVGWLAGCMDGA